MKYNLPRGYLSYSSMSLWHRSKDQFRMKYYSDDSYDLETPYTRFGKMIAETLEDKAKVAAHPVLSQLPLYPVSEHPLLHEVDGVPIKGFIDSFDPEGRSILEIKTGVRRDGKAPWDRVKVRQHEQVLLYSLCVKELYGAVDPVVRLLWLETQWQEVCTVVPFGDKAFQQCTPGLALTGHYEVFERKIADWEHDRMRRLITVTAEQISDDYTRYQQAGIDYRPVGAYSESVSNSNKTHAQDSNLDVAGGRGGKGTKGARGKRKGSQGGAPRRNAKGGSQ